jgi:hypothetical protein
MDVPFGRKKPPVYAWTKDAKVAGKFLPLGFDQKEAIVVRHCPATSKAITSTSRRRCVNQSSNVLSFLSLGIGLYLDLEMCQLLDSALEASPGLSHVTDHRLVPRPSAPGHHTRALDDPAPRQRLNHDPRIQKLDTTRSSQSSLTTRRDPTTSCQTRT